MSTKTSSGQTSRLWNNVSRWVLRIVYLVIVALFARIAFMMANPVSENVMAARAQINDLQMRLNAYKKACGNYPTSEQGLDALVESPAKSPLCANYPASPFIQDGRPPKDPWGNPYSYQSDGVTFRLKSFGKDEREGGEGSDADITL